jgi:uncharacterized membrane-anchored protein YhcB (DUF1043 family)
MTETNSTPAIIDSVVSAFQEAPILADGMIPTAMLGLGIVMMLAILLRRSFRYQQKLKRQSRKAGKPSAKTTRRQEQLTNMFDRASPLLDAPSTILRWQVEMQELGRELKAEIDTKMRLLEVLVRRSNEAAERLEAAASHAERLGCVERTPAADDDSIESLAEQAAIDRTATPSPTVPACSDQVYAMADSGNNAADIADYIGLPVGEIEFVLSLRSQPGDSV